MWKIYKEGQGKVARGTLMCVIGLGSVYAVRSLHQLMPSPDEPWVVGGWAFDYRWLIDAPLLIGAAVMGVWLFNHARTVDFLIDTENELKGKVTWPSRDEEINASVVVLVTVVVMMVWILLWDRAFSFLQDAFY